MLGAQPVLLETDAEARDTDGRRLAYVWLNGNLLNETLVAEGFALAVSHPPNQKYDQRLAHAQDRARALGLGMWNPRQPMRSTPDEFRKQNGKEGERRKEKGEKLLHSLYPFQLPIAHRPYTQFLILNS